jgi:hypothetical protein
MRAVSAALPLDGRLRRSASKCFCCFMKFGLAGNIAKKKAEVKQPSVRAQGRRSRASEDMRSSRSSISSAPSQETDCRSVLATSGGLSTIVQMLAKVRAVMICFHKRQCVCGLLECILDSQSVAKY